MLELNLPRYKFKTKNEAGRLMIFDRCRKKHVALTPEEWVRQNFVEYLINEKRYPPGLISNESTVHLNGLRKRCDTVIYNRNGQPEIIVEYKAPNVTITQETFDQIAMYNFKMQVRYLIVSNGMNHFCCKINYEEMHYEFLREVPECFF